MKQITLTIDKRRVSVAEGSSVAAAIALAGSLVTRLSVSGQLRGPLCGMGVCQECRVVIDGRPHQLSCQTLCAEGMQVQTASSAQRNFAPATPQGDAVQEPS